MKAKHLAFRISKIAGRLSYFEPNASESNSHCPASLFVWADRTISASPSDELDGVQRSESDKNFGSCQVTPIGRRRFGLRVIRLSSRKIKLLNNLVLLHGFGSVWRAYCTVHLPKAGQRCEEAAPLITFFVLLPRKGLGTATGTWFGLGTCELP